MALQSFGLASRIKGKYFFIIESTFEELEIGFPDDEYLEAFAYQIAQRYLYHVLVYKKDNYKDNCEQWLHKTISLADGQDTFYSHLAKLRLRLVETKKPKPNEKPKREAKPKHEALTR